MPPWCVTMMLWIHGGVKRPPPATSGIWRRSNRLGGHTWLCPSRYSRTASAPCSSITCQGLMTLPRLFEDRKSTRLNSSHSQISYAVFCLKKKKIYTCTLLQDTECLTLSACLTEIASKQGY